MTIEQNIQTQKIELDARQEQYSVQKNVVNQLKSEIQVLQSEQKNLNQLMTKNSPKKEVQGEQLMQSLKLNEDGKAQANLIEKFLSKWLSAQVLDASNTFQESIARQLKPSKKQEKFNWMIFLV